MFASNERGGPVGGQLKIELKGNLAAMLTMATNEKRSPGGDLSSAGLKSYPTNDLELQVAMVAGGGFEPPTFGL